jgi:hypothetical protein
VAKDGSTVSTDGSSSTKHPIMAGNVLVSCNTPTAYHLPNAPAADFCAFYEMYCMYDPTGMALNKGQTPAQRPDAKSTAPWYFKDYDDCIMRYSGSTATSQSCRAGQLCRNKEGGCTHSTGHFADCPSNNL